MDHVGGQSINSSMISGQSSQWKQKAPGGPGYQLIMIEHPHVQHVLLRLGILPQVHDLVQLPLAILDK
jgi:hypothetical protein